MIVSGLNENESQEREQGRIMWREIEFHLYRVHLLTLRFFGGNGAKPTAVPPHPPAECISASFFSSPHAVFAFTQSVFISSHPFVIFESSLAFSVSITPLRPSGNDT